MSKKLWHRIKKMRIRQRAMEMQGAFSAAPKVTMSDRIYVVTPAGPWVRMT